MGRYSSLAVAEVFCHFIEAFFSRPRFALRKASKVDMESNIPPILAAHAVFPSEPLPGSYKIFNQLIWK